MHEIVYFNTPGFAEVSRFCLEMSGLQWKNTIVDWDGYLKMKEQGELPWGFLPIFVHLKVPLLNPMRFFVIQVL